MKKNKDNQSENLSLFTWDTPITKSKDLTIDLTNNDSYDPRRRVMSKGSYICQTPENYESPNGIKKNQEVFIKISHYSIKTWIGLGADNILGIVVYPCEYIEYFCEEKYIPYWQVGIEKNKRPTLSIPEAAIVTKLSREDLRLLKLIPQIPRSMIQDIEDRGLEEID